MSRHLCLKFHHIFVVWWQNNKFFIYPPEASYKELKFQFRLSAATVESEESEFKLLPGYYRKLMVLE